jgi:hypothetical protein
MKTRRLEHAVETLETIDIFTPESTQESTQEADDASVTLVASQESTTITASQEEINEVAETLASITV